jgi:hypothetical protein
MVGENCGWRGAMRTRHPLTTISRLLATLTGVFSEDRGALRSASSAVLVIFFSLGRDQA